jgi:hypothetical protein
MSGESRHLTSFDGLCVQNGTTALFDVEKITSSHALKRFFKSFHHGHEKKFGDHLASLFIRRLEVEKPKRVILGVDSMVMDNDDAECRHGVTPTYKNKKGYHPLQMTWGQHDHRRNLSQWQPIYFAQISGAPHLGLVTKMIYTHSIRSS